MGTIKIELDLPEFKKEIELKIVINKDGVQLGTPLVYRQVDNVQVNNPQYPPSTWKEPAGGRVDVTSNKYGTYVTSAPVTNTPNKNTVQSTNTSGIVSSMTGTY